MKRYLKCPCSGWSVHGAVHRHRAAEAKPDTSLCKGNLILIMSLITLWILQDHSSRSRGLGELSVSSTGQCMELSALHRSTHCSGTWTAQCWSHLQGIKQMEV